MFRTIDRVRVKGKQQPVIVYEVFNSDPGDIKNKKQQLLADFETGRLAYIEGKIEVANQCFQRCLEILPQDRVTQLYLDRCQQWQGKLLPSEWDGIENLESK